MVDYNRWSSRMQPCIGFKVHLRFLKDISLGFHDNNGNTYYGLSAHTLCKKYNKFMYPSQINKFINGYQKSFTMENLKRTFRECQVLDENNQTDKEWINGVDAYLKQLCDDIKYEISMETIKGKKRKKTNTAKLRNKTKLKQQDEFLGKYEKVEPHAGMHHVSRYRGKVSQCNQKLQLQSGEIILIKRLRNIEILRDIRMLHVLKHDNIIKLHDIIPPINPKSFTSLMIIYEYMPANLQFIFQTKQFFTRLHVQYMLYHILLAIKYMHSADIVHGNLTPSNVLIDADCTIKICDFNCSFSVNTVQSNNDINNRLFSDIKNNPNQSSYHYAAPEVLLLNMKHETLKAIDLWSAGAMFAELLQMIQQNEYIVHPSKHNRRRPIFDGIIRHFPWNREHQHQLGQMDQLETIFNINVIRYPNDMQIDQLTNKKARRCLYKLRNTYNLPSRRRYLNDMFPDNDMVAINLMKRFFVYDSDKRITVDQALKHKYFKRVRHINQEIEYKDNSAFDIFISIPIDFNPIQSDLCHKILRELILKQVIKYNICHKERIIKSGVMMNGIAVIIDGYVRQYIVPLLSDNVVIPLCVIQICYVYWFGE